MVRMGTIFLLTDTALPEADRIQKVLAAHHPVQVVSSMEALESQLANEQKAVVFFHAPFAKAPTKAESIRNLLKTVACVAVIPQAETEEHLPASNMYDYLVTPFSDFELLSRTATALHITDLLTNLEATAQMDEVTSLYNRGYFFNRINAEISLSKRHLSPLACVVIGINFYQVYMDSYGYDFVLDLLRHVATCVRQQVRQEDILARISDNEIGILLPRSSEKGAKTLTDRIVQAVAETPFHWQSQTPPEGEELSVCAGICGYPMVDEDDLDADGMIRYAHHALHQARCSDEVRVQLFSAIQPAV